MEQSVSGWMQSRAPEPARCLPGRLRSLLAYPPPASLLVAGTVPPRLARRVFVSVGDRVSLSLLAAGHRPRIIVVDCATRRSRTGCGDVVDHAAEYRVVHVSNPRSALTREAVRAIYEAAAVRRPTLVVVDGEEDLLALPAIRAAPHGVYVAYGYPGVAAILAKVGGSLKRLAASLMNEFVPCRPKS